MKFLRQSVLAMALSATVLCMAVPAKRVYIDYLQPDGSVITLTQAGDEFYHYFLTPSGDAMRQLDDGSFAPLSQAEIATMAARAAARRGYATPSLSRGVSASPSRLPENMATTNYPSKGSPKALAVLVQYQDVSFTTPDAHAYFSALLSEKGFSANGATGSVADYFANCSAGQFTPQFDLYGPLTLPQKRSYYGANDSDGNDINPHMMAVHACDILSQQGVDLSMYDTDNDGTIDNIFLFYAGESESSYGGKDTVWPHAWEVYSGAGVLKKYNGKLLNNYACSNEVENGVPDGIGTFCHEFSHVLGLPDLYDTGTGRSITPGDWSILDYGCYNNDARTPPTYSSFERMSLGWCSPVVIDKPFFLDLPPLQDTNIAYVVPTEKDNEFFLFENRRLTGWDSYLIGPGMLVWHIDYDAAKWYNNSPNNDRNHQCVDLVEAVTRKSSYSSANDPFPGNRACTSFTASTTPAFLSWSGNDPGFPFTEIAYSGSNITATVGKPSAQPSIAAPEAPSVKVTSLSEAEISWKPVDGSYFYLLTLTPVSGTSDLELLNIPVGADPLHTRSTLTPGATYDVSVRAIGGSVISDASPKTRFSMVEGAGIENPTVDTVSVTAGNSGLNVAGLKNGASAEVFSIQGVKVREIARDGFYPLPAGIYIVRTGCQTFKVRV